MALHFWQLPADSKAHISETDIALILAGDYQHTCLSNRRIPDGVLYFKAAICEPQKHLASTGYATISDKFLS
jgi:hypothetical protein